MPQTDSTIAFIGAGNMAGSIIAGLIAKGYPAKNISASAPTTTNLSVLESKYHIHTSTQNHDVLQQANVVVLAVKPQNMQWVCDEIKSHIAPGTLVLSVAAGVTCDSLTQWLEQELPIVRCMSNTPAQIQIGASGLFANSNVTEEQKQKAEAILAAVGITHWVEKEHLMDTVTAIAGSAPAYFFLMIEAMIEAGVAQGLDKSAAEALAIQSALGAATLAKTSDEDVAMLRKRVTSPKGTTEQAILSFENNHLRNIVAQAMEACRARAHQIAETLAGKSE